jgi:hypothetical protein
MTITSSRVGKVKLRRVVIKSRSVYENKYFSYLFQDGPEQGYTNPWCHITMVCKLCKVATNICGSSVWNLFHVTILAPRIFMWLLGVGKFVYPWPRSMPVEEKLAIVIAWLYTLS